MAQKRMFNKTLTNSDEFLDLPDSSQVLYFHLSMNADDEGFVNNWKSIIRMTGTKEDDLKLLIAKSFIIPFESGIIVIRHWKLNNYLQNDRIKPTQYQEELKQLSKDKNGVYNLYTKCIHSIDKNSIVENSIEYKKEKEEKEKVEKKKYGEFENVLLTDDELKKLKDKFADYEERIERLSSYLASKGTRYKSHYATILNWSRKDKEQEQVPTWFGKEIKERERTEDEERDLQELIRGY